MKRNLKTLLTWLLALSMLAVLTACTAGQSAVPATQAPDATQAPPANATEPAAPADAGHTVDFSGTIVSIATSPSGGGWYTHASAIANAWMDNLKGLSATAQTSSGTVENIALLQNGRVDIGFFNPDMIYQAINSVENFEGQTPLQGVCHLFNVIPAPMHILCRAGSGIESVEDFVGKRIGVGANDLSSVTLYARVLLDIYGISEDQVTLCYASRQERADALADGSIDVFLEQMNPAAAIVTDLITTHNAYFIGLPSEKEQAIMEKYPYYSPLTITTEDYPIEAPVDGLGSYSFVACFDTLDEELVYQLVKTYCENLDAIGQAYPAAARLTVDQAWQNDLIPLHPGAERYYKEIGVIN